MKVKILPFDRSYSWKHLRSDINAAFTVSVLLIPQGMAYGFLAGLPPIYGLYAGFVPLIIYPFLGTSRFLSVGPVALISIILLSSLSEMATPMSTEYIELAIITALVTGVIQVVMYIFRMGFLVNFLSRPVLSGFISAAAIIIIVSQLKNILGLHFNGETTAIQVIKKLIYNIGNTNIVSLLIGLFSLVLLINLRKISQKIPGALIVTILGILFVYQADLTSHGLDTIGDIPSGLPTFSIPAITWEKVVMIFPLSLIICVISFIESLSIAKTLAEKHNDFSIDANRELLALGFAKIVGSFFQAFPNTGSFSRSAVNENVGSKTSMSSIFAAVLLAIALVYLSDVFYYLPKTILGVIIIFAVIGLIDLQEVKYLYTTDKKDFAIFLATFLFTLIFGIQEGVIVGFTLSIILIIQQISKPHFAQLGKVEGSRHFRNIKRFDNAKMPENTLIFRYDADLFFGNCNHFYNTIMNLVLQQKNLQTLIVNLTALHNLDSTSSEKLIKLIQYCEDHSINIKFTDVKGPVRDKFKILGIYEIINPENIYLSVEDACDDL